MTRLIAGAAGGRRLAVPRGSLTRPTSDRAREGLFSTLESLLGSMAGARFADLYAGSGAVGLEALSRGAAAALFVESHPRTAQVLRDNVRAVGLPGAEVILGTVAAVVTRAAGGPAYDVVFLDPPYALPDAELGAVLAALVGGGWLVEGGVLAVERPTRGAAPRWPAGVRPARSRRYGEATLWYGRAPSPGSTGAGGGTGSAGRADISD